MGHATFLKKHNPIRPRHPIPPITRRPENPEPSHESPKSGNPYLPSVP